MRYSKIAFVIAMMISGHALGQSFDSHLTQTGKMYEFEGDLYVNPNAVTKYDKQLTDTKAEAILGSLYEDEQLEELRNILNKTRIQKNKADQEQLEFPLEPTEIKTIRKKLHEVEKAKMEPLRGVEFKIKNISYRPESSEPLVINIADGFTAQLEFYDSSGQPWPIRKDGVIGDSEGFSKKIMGEHRHIASFHLNSRYKQSNAAIILEGLPTTIPILLRSSDSAVDGRVSVSIPKHGPNAVIMPVYSHEPTSVSSELITLQGGDAPEGSKPLKVTGISNSEAWFDGDHLFLSLPGRLLLPPPIQSSVSPSGRYLYKTDPSTYLTVMVNGERKQGMIQDLYQVEIKRKKTVFESKNGF